MAIKTFAAIVVGSFECNMKIFEFGGKAPMREIDSVTQKLDLGSITYAEQKIDNEHMDEVCMVLKEYVAIAKAYKVEAISAVGTSALREAKNFAIIQDQIEQRTGLRVHIISNAQQRFLNYKSIASREDVLRGVIEEKTAIVDMGGGSMQISLFDEGALVNTQNLDLGVLRIQDLLHSFEATNAQLEGLVEELATAQLSTYKKLYLKDREIKNLIVVDNYINAWAVSILGREARRAMISLEQIEKLIDSMRGRNVVDLAYALYMPEEKVPLVFIGALLVRRIALLSGATCVWIPGTALADGIAFDYGEKKKYVTGTHDFEKDILACARNISKRYQGSRKRGEALEKTAITIYDAMKRVHGLGKRERLYLQLSAILYDCGKYINMADIGENSYHIVMATEFIGLSNTEREMVANIIRFNHTDFIYFGQTGSRLMDRDSYMIVAKLTAMLRLANALNPGGKQKLKGLKAYLKEEELILSVNTQESIALERGFFAECAAFFQEVFSVTPILKQIKQM